PNVIQYAFPTPSEYFTTGNSSGSGFSIIRVRGNLIQPILKLDDNQGIFPLATDGAQQFFLHSQYTDGREGSRVVVSMGPQGKLTPYPHATGLIDSGALLGGTLYFTTYQEKSNDYTLSK